MTQSKAETISHAKTYAERGDPDGWLEELDYLPIAYGLHDYSCHKLHRCKCFGPLF